MQTLFVATILLLMLLQTAFGTLWRPFTFRVNSLLSAMQLQSGHPRLALYGTL